MHSKEKDSWDDEIVGANAPSSSKNHNSRHTQRLTDKDGTHAHFYMKIYCFLSSFQRKLLTNLCLTHSFIICFRLKQIELGTNCY